MTLDPAETAGVPTTPAGSVFIWSGSALVDLTDPDPAAVRLEDVARNLSRLARYTGGTPAFWSVAAHCLFAEALAAADGRSRADRALVLLHDAAEFLVGDVSRPVKIAVPGFRDLEARVWSRAIAPRFGLPEVLPAWVKDYDNRAAAAEGRDLLPEASKHWPGLPPAPALRLWQVATPGGDPVTVESRFLRVARSLGIR